ncbi:MAG TPA: extracellular solute-binding protein [Xanthobacteraceae bacterium]|nr:extracellular solute-binding protein [Xanthobacteraceae bacterium]
MPKSRITRRTVLKGTSALALTAFASPLRAAAPAASTITPALVEAAKKEGKIVWYTSVDLLVAEKMAKAFQAKYPGITPQVERSGAERVFQRIGQELTSNIHSADVVNSSDAAHFIVWKREGLLAPYVPEDVAKHYPAEHKDPDGMYATWRAWLSIIAYNTNLVKAADAPKSFADILDPKWNGKIVKAHPSYSGTILTATYQIVETLGWDYLAKLAKQNVLQVQSSTEPPKKLALGERAVMADGNEYNIFILKESGRPVEPVYAPEGNPIIAGPNGIFKTAPNPNAARLFQSWMFTPEAQELMINVGGLRSVHALVKEKPGRKPLKDIKLMKDNAAAVERQSAEIKAHYTKLFHV